MKGFKSKNNSMKDSYKIATLVFFGFLTVMMRPFVPVGGGGISLIFVISMPFFFILGVLFAIIYYFISKRKASKKHKLITYWLMLTILIVFCLMAYPYR